MRIITRLVRSAAVAATTLLGLLSIVGSGPDAPNPLCDTTLSIRASSTSVAERGKVVLTAVAGGAPNDLPTLTLAWHARRPDDSTGMTLVTRSGIVGIDDIDTYTLDPVIYDESQGTSYWVTASYYCPKTDKLEGVSSERVTLTVTPGPSEWISEPDSVTVPPGGFALFFARAFGDNLYQWQRSSDGFATATDIAGATTLDYDVPSPAVADSGTQFRLKATNRATGEVMVSRSATLTVVDPSAAYSLTASWAPPGTVTVATGSAQLTYLRAVQANGVEGPVDLQLISAPAGLTISPTTIKLPANGGGDYTILFTTDASLAPGSYPMGVALVKDGTTLQTAALTLVVTAPTGTLGITMQEDRLLMVPGRGSTATVLVTPIAGTTANVELDYGGQPPELFVGRSRNFVFSGNGDGRTVAVPYPLTTVGTFPPFGLHTMTFVATESGSTASTTMTIDYRPAATVDVQTGATLASVYTLVSVPGPSYSAAADLVHGQLKLSLNPTTAARPVITTAVGRSTPLQLVNETSVPVSLPAGAFRMEVDGSYTLPAGASLSVLAELAMQYGPASGPARPLGRVEQTVNNTLVDPVPTSAGGMTVDVLRGDRAGLRVNVNSPALTLGAGETITLTAQLSVTDASPSAAADFSTVPLRLCMNLPAGATLSSTSLSQISWCR